MKQLQKKNFPKNDKELKKFSFETSFRLVYISIVLFFLGSFLCVIYGFKTMIPLTSFVRILVLIIIAAYLVQRIFLYTIFPMKRMEYLMLSTFGIGPFLSAVFLILNFYIHTEKIIHVYRLNKVINVDNYQYFDVDNIPCDQYPELCVVREDDLHLKEGEYVKITVAKGLFGFGIVAEVEEVP